ncbi:CD99 molecule isoform X2 [Xiphias gladius]|uniref:CD99 molecule isoform X2 n=1 Tax=Xiphias gladius TaxID=8245 RepID=UPI001A98A126|nr:CD99 molecule isoform X2 [Xiphias gladius]
MKFCLRIVLLLFLVTGTLTEDEFNLFDALDDPAPTSAKPKEQPKAPEKPKTGGGFGLDLEDALIPDESPTEKPKKPHSGNSDGGMFGDSDLSDVSGGDYKPDGGRSGGGNAVDPGYDPQGGADQPQEAGSGQIAGIVSAIGVALVGAASSYFAYQKKKLCFKLQGGADPESGKGQHDTHSDPQVLSNLLRTN